MLAAKFCVTFSEKAMSRIGKKPITIPSGVTINTGAGNSVTVKGPKGSLARTLDPDIKVEIDGAEVKFSRPTDHKRHRALHGLSRQLVHNMVVGVTTGYEKKMELIGVGYKAEAKGQNLELSLGYSHPIVMVFPKEIKLATETLKGQPPTITIQAIDKELIGHFAAKIRSLRAPEPYKGKGIRFAGEKVRRKAGKAAGKGK